MDFTATPAHKFKLRLELKQCDVNLRRRRYANTI